MTQTQQEPHRRPVEALRAPARGVVRIAGGRTLERGLGRGTERTRIAGAISRGLVTDRVSPGGRTAVAGAPTTALVVPMDLLVEVLQPFVTTCVDAFVAAGLDAGAAGGAMVAEATALGRRLARGRAPRESIELGFTAATRAACEALEPALVRHDADALRAARAELTSYARILLGHVLRAWQEMSAVLELAPDARREVLAQAAFGARPASLLDCVAEALEVDLDAEHVAVVSVRDPLPVSVLSLPGALRGPSRREVLLPVEALAAVADDLLGVAVTGPATTLLEAPGAVTLARRAAVLVAEDGDPLACVGRLLVPATDLLGDLLVRGNRLLADLIVAKHLAPLEALSATRRLRLGEIVLHSLECKLPLNQLARRIGIPAQTAHSRMQSARTLLGDALDDPSLHLELIVALRSALPRWREAAAG